MPEERRYFAYGSNLHPMRLIERVGDVELMSIATLPSYELCFDKVGGDGSGKGNIVKADEASEVIGVVYRLTVEQLAKLDVFEALGAGYRHVTIDVMASTGHVPAVSYEAMEEFKDASLVPHEWYRDLVLEGARFHGFPEEYLEMLRGQQVMADPDIARARANETLLERMREAQR